MKVTYEEANKSFEKFYQKTIEGGIISKKTGRKSKLEVFLEQHKPPTWEEVVDAWENTSDDKLKFTKNDEGIRIGYPNVFSANVNVTLHAINLTIRYLENK